MRSPQAHLRRGFTLTELVLSMAVMTVLMGGISSAMLLASRAVPDRKTPLTAVNETYQVVGQIQSELTAAKSVTNLGSAQTTFTVADRNNDGVDESIRYIWSGVPGAPLKRKYNAEALTDVLDDVREFGFAYDLQVVEQLTPPGSSESTETLLISSDATSALNDFAVIKDNFIGECFKPTLPGDATSWKITRIKIKTRTHGANKGITRVQLRPAITGNLPSASVVEEATMLESELSSSYLWREFPFSAASGLSPASGMCLVLQWISDAHSCDVQYRSAGAATFNSNLVRTIDKGASWSGTTESMLYYVYGTITAPTPPQTLRLYYLKGIRIHLRIGDDPGARVETGVQILNQPEVPSL